jgi:hypothetical protein
MFAPFPIDARGDSSEHVHFAQFVSMDGAVHWPDRIVKEITSNGELRVAQIRTGLLCNLSNGVLIL